MLSCPSQRATLRISPVACSVFKAQVCRRTCGDSRLVFKGGHLLTAAGMCLLRICLKPERVRGWARALRNSSGTLASPRMESHARRLPATVFQRVRTRSFLPFPITRSEEHTSELQSRLHLVCRLLLEKKKA